jgi:hypothetical protein
MLTGPPSGRLDSILFFHSKLARRASGRGCISLPDAAAFLALAGVTISRRPFAPSPYTTIHRPQVMASGRQEGQSCRAELCVVL